MSFYINGVGTSFFGKQPAVSLAELAWTAIGEALTDVDNNRTA